MAAILSLPQCVNPFQCSARIDQSHKSYNATCPTSHNLEQNFVQSYSIDVVSNLPYCQMASLGYNELTHHLLDNKDELLLESINKYCYVLTCEIRLLHSPPFGGKKTVSGVWDMASKLAGITLLWLVGWKICLDCLVSHCIVRACGRWEFPLFFKRHWLSFCTSLMAGKCLLLGMCKGTVKQYNVKYKCAKKSKWFS